MGTLEDFLAANEALTQSVVLAGGAQVGRLCVARAVQVMKSTGQDAASALSEAVQIGAACSSWTQRLLESAMDFSREQP
jgi:hypothetical protein